MMRIKAKTWYEQDDDAAIAKEIWDFCYTESSNRKSIHEYQSKYQDIVIRITRMGVQFPKQTITHVFTNGLGKD